MTETFWSVQVLPEGQSRTIKLNVPESYAPLRAFFFEVKDKDYPRIVTAVLKGTGIGFDSTGVNFPEDFDPGEEPPPEGHVEIYDPMTEVYVPEQDFLLVLLDVARIALKTHIERKTENLEWQREMQKGISALEERLGQ